MWLGTPFDINHRVLTGSDLTNNGSEYGELELGYNYNPNSMFAPSNWLNNQSRLWY